MSDPKEISSEEVDLLARSTKKAKVEGIVETEDDVSVVMETATELMGENRSSMNDESMSGSEDCGNEEGHEEDSSPAGDPKCPIVKVTKEERKLACQPWKNSVIVKLLGKRIGLKFLTVRLLKLWNPMGEMEVIDLENDYFLIKFSNFNDTKHVFQGGPWMIMGHYLVVQK
ncbi:hypothetical protein SESBI_36197 [Sesbania bispinosa]|nr:hypothetical protein SESBI_36197 [Sesbania bispinosa]